MTHSLLKPLAVLLAALLPTTLAGCTYLNRSEGVTVHGGNAVRANLERETAFATSKSRYSVKGLGRDGSVVPKEEASATPASSPTP